MYTVGFYRDLLERTVATFAQALVAIFTVLAVEGGGLMEVDWMTALSVSGLAALLAVLKAFAAGASGSETGASFGTAIPKGAVAAVEKANAEGVYAAEEAAPYAEGTPVDVIAENDAGAPDYGNFDHEIDGPLDDR